MKIVKTMVGNYFPLVELSIKKALPRLTEKLEWWFSVHVLSAGKIGAT